MLGERLLELWEEVQDLDERLEAYALSDVEEDKIMAEQVIHQELSKKQRELWNCICEWRDLMRRQMDDSEELMVTTETLEFMKKLEEPASYFINAMKTDQHHIMIMSGVFDDDPDYEHLREPK